MSGRPTVLSLVNRLKIEQDKAKGLFDDSQRLINQAQDHLNNAHATLVELAELQGIAIPPENPLDRPPYGTGDIPAFTPRELPQGI